MLYLHLVLAVAALLVAAEIHNGWVSRRVLLFLHFQAFSPRSPRIEARLEAARQAVAGAHVALDAARIGPVHSFVLATHKLDAAWKRLANLGGIAFLCGAPASRRLQTRNGRLRLQVLLSLVAILFATNAIAAPTPGLRLTPGEKVEISNFRQAFREAREYVKKPRGSCGGEAVAGKLVGSLEMVNLQEAGIQRRNGISDEAYWTHIGPAHTVVSALLFQIDTIAGRELVDTLRKKGACQGDRSEVLLRLRKVFWRLSDDSPLRHEEARRVLGLTAREAAEVLSQ